MVMNSNSCTHWSGPQVVRLPCLPGGMGRRGRKEGADGRLCPQRPGQLSQMLKPVPHSSFGLDGFGESQLICSPLYGRGPPALRIGMPRSLQKPQWNCGGTWATTQGTSFPGSWRLFSLLLTSVCFSPDCLSTLVLLGSSWLPSAVWWHLLPGWLLRFS